MLKVREFNPRYAKGALTGQLRHHHTDIYGNGEFVEHLRKHDLMNYNNKLEAICCNHGTPS